MIRPRGLVPALVALAGAGASCRDAPAPRPAGDPLPVFLADYGERYRELRREATEAEWALNTRIEPGDTTRAAAARRARLAVARFAGSAENIATVRAHLETGAPTPLERRQLEAMLRLAAESPAVAGPLLERRVRLETSQLEVLFGFEYRLAGRPVSTAVLDRILREETDLDRRRAAWEASKEVGAALRPGLLPLAVLRNGSVRALGYDDYFDFKAADYGLDRAGVLGLAESLLADLWPLYRELHTWARYTLAARYGAEVPALLPAHWLPDRWGQDWSALLEGDGAGLDSALAGRDPAWIVDEAEGFYRSLGFEPLPSSFGRRSSLYPLRPGAPYRKNDHASAWHVDLERDVRALMSVEPGARWYATTHHELGHLYYYLAYGRPDVPVVLRRGANRAFHEAIGSLLGLAATQERFLRGRGLLPAREIGESPGSTAAEAPAQLLREALRYAVFVPWSAAVMTRYESELYGGELDPAALNRRWWDLVRRYQGIVPPRPRGEEHADAASKTHITNDPAEYYDYAVSQAILFQLHERIARDLLGQDPHDTDYWGRSEVGDLLRTVMEPGASRPWELVLEEATGAALNGDALARYFEPLESWLRERNAGRTATLPVHPDRFDDGGSAGRSRR